LASVRRHRLVLAFKDVAADAQLMGMLVVVGILVVLAIFGLTGWGVADSRDGRDWKPTNWPTRRR
jgi:hypothetical protein